MKKSIIAQHKAIACQNLKGCGLHRHGVNETYYGIKKWAGKRKEHSLDMM
jgi:hypothetical protein